MKILHEITLDVSRSGVQATIPLTNLDGGVHRILVRLRNGSTPLALDADDTAAFYLDRDMLDPVTVYTSSGVYPNTLCYDVSQYATMEEGLFYGTFIINKKAESIVYSPQIALAIQKNITSSSAMLDAPQYGALVKLAAESEDYAAEAAKQAEESALSAKTSLALSLVAKEHAFDAKTSAESSAVAREKSENAAAESLYYSELSRKAMENQEGSRAFVVDTLATLLNFVCTGKPHLYRVRDGMRVHYSPKDLETGDTIYVKELEVPDFWWVKTDTADGAFVYKGETLAYPLAKTTSIAERMAEIDAVIAEQNAAFPEGETVVNTDGDALTPDYDWYLYGKGTEEEPYRIGSPAALLGLSNLSNGLYDPAALGETEAAIQYFNEKYFIQTANIDMGGAGFMPISFEKRESYDSPTDNDNYDKLFYDGGGHYIANFVQSGYRVGGIFGNVGGGGSIKNLTLKGANITANADAGGIAGVLMAGMNISNCHVDATSTITSLCVLDGAAMEGNAGGIAGYFTLSNGISMQSNVAYCTNEAAIASAARAGGLFGSVKEGAVSQFAYCANKGTVTVNGTKRTPIGGIVGWVTKDSAYTMATAHTFSHCYNTGTLHAETTNQYLFMGGIVGDVRGDAISSLTLEYCYDYSKRYYVKSSGADYNYGLVGVYDDAQINKRYAYCHAANSEFSKYPYMALGHYMDKSNVTVESCSITSDVDIYVTDTYPEIIFQLQPLEAITAEMQDKIEALQTRLNDAEKRLSAIPITFHWHCSNCNKKYTYSARAGTTWLEWFNMGYDGTCDCGNGIDEYSDRIYEVKGVGEGFLTYTGDQDDLSVHDTILDGVVYSVNGMIHPRTIAVFRTSDGSEWKFEKGMTWYEFCKSVYNIDNTFQAYDDTVMMSDGTFLGSPYAIGSQMIFADTTYVRM